MSSSPINVVYAVDVQGAGAVQFQDQIVCSMKSIIRSRAETDDVRVTIVYGNMTSDLAVTLLALKRDRFDVRLVRIKEPDLRFMQSCTRQPASSPTRAWCGIVHARLFLAQICPDLDRCIYLDADTLVRASLAELWAFDLGKKRLGLAPGVVPEYGYNSGVILMDLARLRADDSRRLCDFMKDNARTYLLPDQTVINRFYADDIAPLPAKWNYPPVPRQFGSDRKGLAEAAIWHFYNQGQKPIRFDDQGLALVEWNRILCEK